MGVRRKGREIALQILYLTDVAKMRFDDAQGVVLRTENLDKEAVAYSKKIAADAFKHLERIDEVVQGYAANWELKRMAALDRNILRLGAYELLHETDTPSSVVIDEAVEIAKAFSTDDSGKFVNGILDKIKIEYVRKNNNA
jgi:N utilization substance protein B